MSEIINAVVPITAIKPHPENYNMHPEEQIRQLEASYETLGQFRSVVLWQQSDSSYIQLAGHGVVEAMKREGATEVRADILPPSLDAMTAKRIMLADNLHAQNSSPDETLLVTLLQEQQDAGYDLASLGTDDESLRQMLESLGDEILAQDMQEEEYSEGEEDDIAASTIFSDETIVEEAFKHFRNTGFPYRDVPVHVCMEEINRLAVIEDDRLLNTRAAYHVADTYHRHRFHASAENMKSPYEAFHDDKTFRHALTLQRECNRAIGYDVIGKLLIVSGTQACSNFRPGFAKLLYCKYCKPGMTVLDTSTGYGGRLVGFMTSGIAGKYIGIDPNTETHNANLRMARDLHFSDKVELYNLPAEDVDPELLRNRCDFAFTSPPYFAKEHYSDEETQSWKRYSTGDVWRVGFLQKMLALQFAALKPASYAIVNIADVNMRGKTYPLVQWTIEDGKRAGFEYLETQKFELTHRFGAGQDDEVASEPVIVFRKPAKELLHA